MQHLRRRRRTGRGVGVPIVSTATADAAAAVLAGSHISPGQRHITGCTRAAGADAPPSDPAQAQQVAHGRDTPNDTNAARRPARNAQGGAMLRAARNAGAATSRQRRSFHVTATQELRRHGDGGAATSRQQRSYDFTATRDGGAATSAAAGRTRCPCSGNTRCPSFSARTARRWLKTACRCQIRRSQPGCDTRR
jgi:hypothetical protein